MISNCGAGEDLRVPWTAGRSNQSILKEINPKYLLEELMLKQASILWSSDATSQIIEKDHDARKDSGQEEKKVTENETLGWHH